MTGERLDQAIENYGETAKAASTGKVGTVALAGLGAAAAGGLFTASEADAGIVYSGIINVGFLMSTVNASSTNTFSPPLVFNSVTFGNPAFGIAGNNRGPNNAAGPTDIIWALGAGNAYVPGGLGGVFATRTPFPANVQPQFYSSTIPGNGQATSLAWIAAGAPSFLRYDPFGAGSTGSVTGYFGFSFYNFNGQFNFGWARIQLQTLGGQPFSINVVDYAYDNMGNPIHVGTIPEPGSAGLVGLCALAAGAAGIRRRRKEKAQAS